MSNEQESIYLALVGMFIIQGVMSSCIEGSGINATQVARMCHNSTVTGTSVYIDAEAAGSTTLPSGVPCTCTVTWQGGKVIKAQSSFTGTSNPQCGTTMEYTAEGLPGVTLSHSCNSTGFNVTTQPNRNMTVGLRKDQPPYSTQYCVSFELQYCSPGQFQCNSGECIPEKSKCDSNPDCEDKSDEDNCGGPVQCTEGQVLCEDGHQCRPQNGRCNNFPDCKDGSDEQNCDSGSGISTTKAPNASNTTTPQITVTCTESEFLPQTTTTTATTTTTTSTTTTTLTTTTAPATTTTSTTATTTTPTTTTAPTTTTTSTTTTTTPTTTTTTSTAPTTTTTTSKTTTNPQTTTSKTTTVSPTTTFSPTTSSETQPNTPTTTTNAPTTTPIKTTANSVPSASPPIPTTSTRSSTTMDISTSTLRTDYSKPAPDPFPPWLIAVIVCVCVLVILAVVVAILCQLTSKCDNYKPHSKKRRQRNYMT